MQHYSADANQLANCLVTTVERQATLAYLQRYPASRAYRSPNRSASGQRQILAVHFARNLAISPRPPSSLLQNTMTLSNYLLCPTATISSLYDLCILSSNSITNYESNIHCRNYITTIQTPIQIRLSPPISSKYLNGIYSYPSQTIQSSENAWQTHEKIRHIEITLCPNQFLFIPAYWWISIKTSPDSPTILLSWKYHNVASLLSCAHYYIYSELQNE